MALRAAHGHARGAGPQVEVMPADELPTGVPAAPQSPLARRRVTKGPLTPGEEARRIGRLGGAARAQQIRLAKLLGRVELPESHPVRGYRRDAEDWRDAHLKRLAETVGGGEVGPGVQMVVSTAALQHAASRWLFDRSALELDATMAMQASKLADSARQNLLAAHELCAKEALARRAQRRQDPQAALRARLGLGSGQQDGRRPEQAADEVAPGGAVARGGAVEPVE